MIINCTSVSYSLKKVRVENIYFLDSGNAASVAALMVCAYDTGAEMGRFCFSSQRHKLLDIGRFLRVYTQTRSKEEAKNL
jgi:hypothetical protein